MSIIFIDIRDCSFQNTKIENIFYAITNLEKIICSWSSKSAKKKTWVNFVMQLRRVLSEKRNSKQSFYLYCKNNLNDSEISIKFLIMFGTLTVELVDMLEQIKDEIDSTFWHQNYLKQVSNRDAIEQLFRVLECQID